MSRVSEIMDSMEYGPSAEDSSAARDWLTNRAPFGHFIGGKFHGITCPQTPHGSVPARSSSTISAQPA